THYDLLTRNLRLNDAARVTALQMAVSSTDGQTEFVRVLGNTTGSHLAGSKAAPYGELQRFPVKTVSFRSLVAGVDLLKLDAEGHEQQIITSTLAEDWAHMDGLISVHDKANAYAVFEHLTDLKLHMFSQKINWQRVANRDDMPLSHHEGTLFVSHKSEMPWA
ncbi:MAG: FkbM family methyltransferase, partial [bacterium]